MHSWEAEVQLGKNVGQRWASRPGCLNPRGGSYGTNYMGGWVSPRAGHEILQKGVTSRLFREMNHDSSDAQPVGQSLYWLSYPGSEVQLITV